MQGACRGAGTADAVVFVDLDDLAAHAAGDIAQLALLVGRGLIDRRDPEIGAKSPSRLLKNYF